MFVKFVGSDFNFLVQDFFSSSYVRIFIVQTEP